MPEERKSIQRRAGETLPNAEAWAEMLAKIAGKNIRLQAMLAGKRKQQNPASLFQLERERSRIARELHAGAGQPLAAIKLNLELLGECHESMRPEARDVMVRLHLLADAALEQVRAVSHRLQPPEWQQLTTDAALRRLIYSSGIQDAFETRVDVERLEIEPAHSTKVVLYRCAQECIANIVRHSRASKIDISLRLPAGAVELKITDNGRGMEAGRGEAPAGIGLRSIREQVSALGGICRIVTGFEGTTIAVTVPLTED